MNEHGLKRRVHKLFVALQRIAPVMFVKLHGNRYQKANQPDYILSICGMCVALELKSPTEKAVADPGQQIELDKWARSEATSVVFNSYPDIQKFVSYKLMMGRWKLTADALALLTAA